MLMRSNSNSKNVAGPDIPRPAGPPPIPTQNVSNAKSTMGQQVPKIERVKPDQEGIDKKDEEEPKNQLNRKDSFSKAASSTEYNFGAASSRDNIVFGSERPGYIHPSRDQAATPRGPDIDNPTVTKWKNYMYSQGIRRVLCVLNKDEISFYSHSIIESLQQRFSVVTHVDISIDRKECPFKALMKAMLDAETSGEPVLIFCSTGQVRTAYVLALWLSQRYSISIDDAILESMTYAQANGIARKPTVDGVLKLMLGSSQSAVSSLSCLNIGTPRADTRLHVSFVQMGGTIDKDYPKTMNAYGFEIGDAASKRVLRNVPCGFTYDSVSICKKDSQDITPKDRATLLDSLAGMPSKRIIITHGTDTLLETAQYIGQSAIASSKTIILTGATKPEKMVDSDAAFNIGCSIGLINLLESGVYVCMNGRIFQHGKCKRDGKSGLFEEI